MKQANVVSVAGIALLLGACVTVNVYFPAAAAERAADRIVDEIYGADSDATRAPAPPAAENPQTLIERNVAPGTVQRIVDWVIPAASAQQPDINVSSPGINALRQAMEQRHQQLRPHYLSGAIGMTRNGTLELRDPAAVELRERNTAKQLIADENRDRNQLYAAIAELNGHPEWETDIRGIFATYWVSNAPAGWWYQGSAGWQQK